MSEEDTNLSQSMTKLKIMPKPKQIKLYRDDNLPIRLNPFAKRLHYKTKPTSTLSLFGPTCLCGRKRIGKKSYKKHTSNKRNIIVNEQTDVLKTKSDSFGDSATHQDFRSIIQSCQQLSLSMDNNNVQTFPNQSFQDQSQSARSNDNRELSTCSQQAMARFNLNPPCDVTIDELASYFETFVHIPKKMSSMAEMMYI